MTPFEKTLQQYFNKTNLDIRKKIPGYSRYMDQKVTPDVLSFISDCVVNLLGGKKRNSSFTVLDIWQFPYFIKNIVAVFGKPTPNIKSAKAEYNKFIGQPLKTLAFAKILGEKKNGNKNTYTILEPAIIESIAQNEKNAWYFLVYYLEKVLSDSGFIDKLKVYKSKGLKRELSEQDFTVFKKKFQSFMRGYTEITGNLEINRIFPKVLNPLAAFYQMPGTEKGHMTSYKFIYPDLMYNRKNFRDVQKNKAQTRKEAGTKTSNIQTYRVARAKNIIRRYHKDSEVRDSLSVGVATQVHHIFPETKFPEISAHIENLILLTPQQHNTRAHPNNKTQEINPDYQKACLSAKLDSIMNFLSKGENIYSLEKFIDVLNTGLGLNLSSTISLEDIKAIINLR